MREDEISRNLSQPQDAAMEMDWKPQPEAAALIEQLVTPIAGGCPFIAGLADRMRAETGTRLIDWVDHLALPHEDAMATRLEEVGFEAVTDTENASESWTHAGGLFPAVRLRASAEREVVLKVDSVVDFVCAHRLADSATIDGLPGDPIRRAQVATAGHDELHVMERHGSRDYQARHANRDGPDPGLVQQIAESFRLRRRRFDNPDEGFQHARRSLEQAFDQLGRSHVCDLFFHAERSHWQSRNRAARVQKSRQDVLGLGWGNHDHHTYRSSRECFSLLVDVLELMGFVCRERFYAGSEAGWGAQVLEHSDCGIVIFADVDLSPEEVAGDFAHNRLPPRDELGTVGLWCRLHGEAFLEAGLHHLECQFDFDTASDQLRPLGIETMKPFTDLPHLRQAFTAGEVWPVETPRIDALLAAGRITPESAEAFRAEGAIGSHLEILERNAGYKGFNQTGISDIIRETDPRRQAAASCH